MKDPSICSMEAVVARPAVTAFAVSVASAMTAMTVSPIPRCTRRHLSSELMAIVFEMRCTVRTWNKRRLTMCSLVKHGPMSAGSCSQPIHTAIATD